MMGGCEHQGGKACEHCKRMVQLCTSKTENNTNNKMGFDELRMTISKLQTERIKNEVRAVSGLLTAGIKVMPAVKGLGGDWVLFVPEDVYKALLTESQNYRDIGKE